MAGPDHRSSDPSDIGRHIPESHSPQGTPRRPVVPGAGAQRRVKDPAMSPVSKPEGARPSVA